MFRTEERIPRISRRAEISPNATILGDVVVDDNVSIGMQSVVRGDFGTPHYIGKNTTIQDFVSIRCRPQQMIRFNGKEAGVYIEDQVEILSHAALHGPLFIGRNTRIGQNVSINMAVIGRDCIVMDGAIISGRVRIPDGRLVRPGTVIWKQEQADQLPVVSEASFC